MEYLGEDPKKIDFLCAGINHMAFYLRLTKDGTDLYPRLFAAMNNPAIYQTNPVRFELMRVLGYFVTESSEHNAEYNPYFIPHGEECIRRFNVPIDEYLRRCEGIVEEFERMKHLSRSDEQMEVGRSPEYGATIIHSIASGQKSVVYGNQPKRGNITNLPDSAITEVPVVVDRDGLTPQAVGTLPPQLIAYMQPHVAQQELFIRAVIEGRRDHVYQAMMFDPLTAAVVPLDQIVEMCDELIAAHGDLLPPLKSRTLVPSSGKTFGPVDGSVLVKKRRAGRGST
jgi:alpha-galactosidase